MYFGDKFTTILIHIEQTHTHQIHKHIHTHTSVYNFVWIVELISEFIWWNWWCVLLQFLHFSFPASNLDVMSVLFFFPIYFDQMIWPSWISTIQKSSYQNPQQKKKNIKQLNNVFERRPPNDTKCPSWWNANTSTSVITSYCALVNINFRSFSATNLASDQMKLHWTNIEFVYESIFTETNFGKYKNLATKTH